MLLRCPAKLLRATRIVGVVHPTKSKQNLRVSWKPVNPQDCVWENHCRIIMKTILQEKVRIHYSITIWFTNLSYAPSHENSRSRSSSGQGMGKIRKFRRGTWQKSKVRKRWSMKRGRRALQFILHHFWTYVISRIRSWSHSTKNTKVELYSEAVLWKTIQGLMQYLPSKDHQHLKWQQLRSWISSPDCLVAMDKQLSQYLLKPRWKWKMLQNYWKFPNRNVQTFGFVYHDTNGLNNGPVWKIQSFLLNEICMVILWQDYYGKGNLRKSYWNMVGRRFPIGMLIRRPWKRVVLICVCGWHQIGWKETRH